MSDLGSDTGNAALSMGGKILEAVLKLFEKAFEAWGKRHERELTKLKTKNEKAKLEKQESLDRLNGKTGWVNYQDLKKSGQELTPLGIYMTKDEMKEFSALCKREGVQFSGMTDSTQRVDGRKAYEIICKKGDVEKIAGIVDRLNDEKMIAGIDNRIAELEAKGENMTEQDKIDIQALKEQKAAIQKGYCEKLNDEMSQNVIDRAVTGEAKQGITLDEALNSFTGREINKDVTFFVVDANDPSKYIKCHGYQDIYENEKYVKTDYEVYRDGQVVFKTDDGRFDGRPQNYWKEQKAAIQEAGDFSGTFFIFYTEAEYVKWAEYVKNENETELTSMVKDGEKDYESIIGELETQLDKDGAKLQDGIVVDKETGEPLKITEGMSQERQAEVAEAIVIGKQIDNYNEISSLESEMSVAKVDVLTTEEGTPQRAVAEEKLSEITERYNTALEKEQQLLGERKDINAVQAEQDVRNTPVQEQNHDKTQMLDSIEKTSENIELAKSKGYVLTTVDNAEHPDNRRTERVDEKDKKQMSMKEAEGQIEQSRAKDGAKGNDVKDRQVFEQGAKVATGKTSKDSLER